MQSIDNNSLELVQSMLSHQQLGIHKYEEMTQNARVEINEKKVGREVSVRRKKCVLIC